MSSPFTMELFEKFDRLKDSIPADAHFKNFLENFKRPEYSMNNKMLVFMQNPKATDVQGFTSRKAKSRTVRKGERALYVFAMNTTEKEDEKTGEKKVRKYFGIRPVFDITQTDEVAPTPTA